MPAALASSAVMSSKCGACDTRLPSRRPERLASPTTPAQLTHASVPSPTKLSLVSCSCCVGAGAVNVRVVSAGRATAAVGTLSVARLSDRRPRCAEVEKDVSVLPAASGVAFRGARVILPSSSARMTGLRPAVLAGDRGAAKVAPRTSSAGSPALSRVPSARHATSWWSGANGVSGSGGSARVAGVGRSCTR